MRETRLQLKLLDYSALHNVVTYKLSIRWVSLGPAALSGGIATQHI